MVLSQVRVLYRPPKTYGSQSRRFSFLCYQTKKSGTEFSVPDFFMLCIYRGL
nr:MAG TPA: hypothetical protein [Caudoviricetes sp.]